MNYSSNKTKIVIFSKIPSLRPVKTRLIDSSCLLPAEVEKLALCLLGDTIDLAYAHSNDLIFNCDPLVSKSQLTELFSKHELILPEGIENITLKEQIGDSFSERLLNISRDELFSDSGLLIIGSDSALYPRNALAGGLDAVANGLFSIGPSVGCGLYYIGIPSTAIAHGINVFSIFDELSRSEIEDFSKEVRRQGFQLEVGPLHFDIDVEEDLMQLVALSNVESDPGVHSQFSPSIRTREYLSELSLKITRSVDDTRSLELNKS
jgi:glycosyltransferase A (GT-A) superfamily protein (DUF2064 family)